MNAEQMMKWMGAKHVSLEETVRKLMDFTDDEVAEFARSLRPYDLMCIADEVLFTIEEHRHGMEIGDPNFIYAEETIGRLEDLLILLGEA